MKHFIVELTYTVPIERINQLVTDHRAYLKKGYDAGMLLMSGPQEPKVGGMIVARAATLEALQAYFKEDPFFTNNAATYKYVEFTPVRHQPMLQSWVA